MDDGSSEGTRVVCRLVPCSHTIADSHLVHIGGSQSNTTVTLNGSTSSTSSSKPLASCRVDAALGAHVTPASIAVLHDAEAASTRALWGINSTIVVVGDSSGAQGAMHAVIEALFEELMQVRRPPCQRCPARETYSLNTHTHACMHSLQMECCTLCMALWLGLTQPVETAMTW